MNPATLSGDGTFRPMLRASHNATRSTGTCNFGMDARDFNMMSETGTGKGRRCARGSDV
jgi:hypothetical protein